MKKPVARIGVILGLAGALLIGGGLLGYPSEAASLTGRNSFAVDTASFSGWSDHNLLSDNSLHGAQGVWRKNKTKSVKKSNSPLTDGYRQKHRLRNSYKSLKNAVKGRKSAPQTGRYMKRRR